MIPEALLAPVTVIRKIRSRQVSVVEIEIPEEHHKAATALFDSELVLVTRAPDSLKSSPYGILSGEGPQEPTEPPPKSLAAALHAKGYWRNPKLWTALARDGWMKTTAHLRETAQAECLAAHVPTAFWPLFPDARVTACSGDTVVHHVRNAANAGTGSKPDDWYVVPLCAAHHVPVVHDHGTAAGRAWLLERAVALTAERARLATKQVMRRESLSGVTAEDLAVFEAEIDLYGEGRRV